MYINIIFNIRDDQTNFTKVKAFKVKIVKKKDRERNVFILDPNEIETKPKAECVLSNNKIFMKISAFCPKLCVDVHKNRYKEEF